MALFEQLMADEEGHIDFLETQRDLLQHIGEQNYGQLNAGSAGRGRRGSGVNGSERIASRERC